MRLDLGVQFVVILAILATYGDARSMSEVQLQDGNGLAACEVENNPIVRWVDSGWWPPRQVPVHLCDSVTLPDECEKNSTVRQGCQFSCSLSGQLWWAASRGNLSEVNTAIAAGANPMCHRSISPHYHKNMTALHLAALGNHQEMAVALLDAGVDVNIQTTDDGRTPAYYASEKGSYDVLKVLIEQNADIDIADSTGMTPLMASTRGDHLSIAKALIDANANLDATGGYDNATALIHALLHASIHSDQEMALLLIEHNADVNIGTTEGLTPLMRASRFNKGLDVVKALINANASLDVTGGGYGSTALYTAVQARNPDIVSFLIDQGADVNIPAASTEKTPLMEAADIGHLGIAKALINANASIDAINGRYNYTALYWATYRNHPDIVSLLIEHNADLNIPIQIDADIYVVGGSYYATALYIAVNDNHPEIAQLLIDNNADVNIPSTNGMTPLMVAASEGHRRIAKALINANASLNVMGGLYNATALYYAIKGNNQDIVSLLTEHNAVNKFGTHREMTPLMKAASEWEISKAKAIIDSNASLDVTGGLLDATALHYAVSSYYTDGLDIAVLLLQSGADTTILNRSGETPAVLARSKGKKLMADLIDGYTTANNTKGELSPYHKDILDRYQQHGGGWYFFARNVTDPNV